MFRSQLVQNNAEPLMLKKKKSTSSTPLLRELLWLPIAQRIDYKCVLLCFKCIYGVAPNHLRKLFLIPAKEILTLKRGFLRVRNTNDKIKIFCNGPRILNSLPKRIRDIDKLKSFKKEMKHDLFPNAICEE